MKTTSGILLAAVSFATAAMMQSCEKKDLCYDHGHMVDLQITNSPTPPQTISAWKPANT